MTLHKITESVWYEKHPLTLILLPLSLFYQVCIKIRNLLYTTRLLSKYKVSVPVIVVGNITVGGNGKTPFVIWLCQFLTQKGYFPGIISRGYGGDCNKSPQLVTSDSSPSQVGDEPLLLAQRSGRPVIVFHNRYLAAVQLLKQTNCNILVCDDGLQHLSLERELEIVVIDGNRRFGNGYCLPAGPLRDSINRLSSVDIIVAKNKALKNEHLMNYEYEDLQSIHIDKKSLNIQKLHGKTVHAVAGIANPFEFHSYLKNKGVKIIKHVFPDHHAYVASDLEFNDNLPIVMTEKDAVKCKTFVADNMWYLPIKARMDNKFHYEITNLLKKTSNG